MIEILFRGKCKYNSLWICGSLISYNGKYFIIPTGVVYPEENGKYEFSFFEVDPKTVGRWTGEYSDSIINIKNDDIEYEKIFEGDILSDCIGEYALTWVVYYVCAEYILKNNMGNTMRLYGYVDGRINAPLFHIGNIHDNPELLEAK